MAHWLCVLLFTFPVLANAQLTRLVGRDIDDSQTAARIIRALPDNACKWKHGPNSVRPENLSPETLNFVGADDGTKVRRICEGTISCEVEGMLWQSDLYLACGMRETNCDAKKCWAQYLTDRVAFLKVLDPPVRSATVAPSAAEGGRR